MADRLDIEVTGFGFLSAIDRAASQLEHPVELMRLIGQTLRENIDHRFDSRTDPAGNPWLPLSPKTLARKKGRGSMLVATGVGRRSLTLNAGDDFVEIGFGQGYMGYHETGTQRMPRRQLLTDDFVAGTLGAQDQADVLAGIEAFLNGLGLS